VKASNLRDEESWETLSSEMHFANSHLDVVTDQVRTPSRSDPRSWTIVRRKPAVVIAPITREGEIILIREERIPIRAALWSVPAGQIDGPREPKQKEIEATALRELHEETGYELAAGGELIALGHYFCSPGLTDERGYFFLARSVQSSSEARVHDESESILDCRPFSVVEFLRMVAENEIRDANTLSICACLLARGLISRGSC
jgi:ADP-ribose pyrophosphatase